MLPTLSGKKPNTMEKVDLGKQEVAVPEIIQLQTSTNKPVNWKLVAGLVIGVLTMVVLATGATGYIVYLEARCNTVPDYREKYNPKNDQDSDDKQNVEVDRQHHIEKITNRNQKEEVTSVVVFNHHMRIISMYLPKEETCYLIGGITEEIGSFEESIKVITQEITKDTVMVNVSYQLQDSKPVYDNSFLTDDLRAECSKGNLYWLSRTDGNGEEEPEKPREKRRICGYVCFYVRVRVGRFYYRVRRCYYRCLG